MYELLSQRPVSVPGQRTCYTAQWDDKQVQSREYTLPVKRNQRTKIARTRKHSDDDVTAAAPSGEPEKTPRKRHSLKAVVGMLMQGNAELYQAFTPW